MAPARVPVTLSWPSVLDAPICIGRWRDKRFIADGWKWLIGRVFRGDAHAGGCTAGELRFEAGRQFQLISAVVPDLAALRKPCAGWHADGAVSLGRHERR